MDEFNSRAEFTNLLTTAAIDVNNKIESLKVDNTRGWNERIDEYWMNLLINQCTIDT